MNRPSLRPSLALTVALAGSLCLVTGFQQSASAQQTPNFTQTNPGVILPDPSNAVQRDTQRKREKFLPDPDASVPDVKIDAPDNNTTVQLQSTQFKVNKITVENAAILTPAEVSAVTQPLEGKEVTLTDLQAVVDQLNKLYRDKGYLTTQAYVPPQDVQNGDVVIKVVEGKVGKMTVTGNHFNRTRAVVRNLDARPGQPFNLRSLEKDLNRTNNFNSNYRLRATLAPGANTGETDVRIDVAEKQPWQISLTADNQGRPFIGQYRGGVEVRNDSLFGYGDRLTGTFISSGRTNIGLASYFVPLNGRGTQLGVTYGITHVDVDTGTDTDITGLANNLGLILSHPFDRERVFTGDIGFNLRTITSSINGDRSNRDEIRSLQAGLNFNKQDRVGQTFARLQAQVAPDNFLGSNTSFFKAEAFLTRVFTLPKNNLLVFRFYGQYSPDDLPSAELFQIGGAYSVRGYTEGVVLGDSGVNFSVEDRFPIPFLSGISPWLAQRLQGAVFADIGHTVYDKSNPIFVNSNVNRSQTLASVGFGFRARLSQYLQGFLDVGFGLVDRALVEPKGAPSARIHFGVRSSLLPEVYKGRSQAIDLIQPVGQGKRFSVAKNAGTATPLPDSNAQPLQAEPANPTGIAPDGFNQTAPTVLPDNGGTSTPSVIPMEPQSNNTPVQAPFIIRGVAPSKLAILDQAQ